ncbi:MAG: PAS domain-containing protein, partial [Planctomycetota bacterium]
MEERGDERVHVPRDTKIPSWVHLLGIPAWISGPDRRLLYMNPAAESLFGRAASTCMGKLCYETIAAKSPGGESFCKQTCPFLQMARSGIPIEARRLCLQASDGQRHDLSIFSIPLWSEDQRL